MDANDILNLIDNIASKIGPTGQHVFELAVRQVVAKGITSGIAAILLVLTGIVVLVGVSRIKDWDEIEFMAFFGSVCAIPIGAGVFIFGSLMTLLNPEWEAIQMLAGLVVK